MASPEIPALIRPYFSDAFIEKGITGEWNQATWYWILFQMCDHVERHGKTTHMGLSLSTIKVEVDSPFTLLRMLDHCGLMHFFNQVIGLLIREMRQNPTDSIIQKSIEDNPMAPLIHNTYQLLVAHVYAEYRHRFEGALLRLIGKGNEGLVKRIVSEWTPSVGQLVARTREILFCLTSKGTYTYTAGTAIVQFPANPFARIHMHKLDEKSVIGITCGESHIAVLRMDGLFIHGDNSLGQHGLGHERQVPFLGQKMTLEGVLAVKCGHNFTAAQTIDGFFVWGAGIYSFPIVVPTKFDIPGRIRTFACGATHLVIVTNEGVFSMGVNRYGQLGLGDQMTFSNVIRKVNLQTDSDIVHVECGAYFTMLLSAKGTLYACGANEWGQLGFVNRTTYRPRMYGEVEWLFRQRKETERAFSTISNFVQVGESGSIMKVTCGHEHAILVRRDGAMLGTGAYLGGQLGFVIEEYRDFPFDKSDNTDIPFMFELDMAEESDVIDVIACRNSTFLIKRDGLYIAGANPVGEKVIDSLSEKIEIPMRVNLEIGYENKAQFEPTTMRLSTHT